MSNNENNSNELCSLDALTDEARKQIEKYVEVAINSQDVKDQHWRELLRKMPTYDGTKIFGIRGDFNWSSEGKSGRDMDSLIQHLTLKP